MFKFVHVWGIVTLGKIRLAFRKNETAVGERICGARPKKNWVGGRIGFFILAKSGPEKNLPGLFATSGKGVLQSRVQLDVI